MASIVKIADAAQVEKQCAVVWRRRGARRNRPKYQPQSTYLAERAPDFARQVLKPNGAVLIKTFQGAGFQQLVESARRSFNKVRFAKPDACRARSSEPYLLASGFGMV